MSVKMIVVSPLDKVFLDQAEPAPISHGLSGFQNEVISFQVAFKGEGETFYHSQFASIRIESPIAQHVRARRVRHVPVGVATFPDADENYLKKTPGLFPDLLTDLNQTQLRVYSDQWQTVWIDVEPDGEVASGMYRIDIILEDDKGREFARQRAMVEILPGILPEQDLIHTKWLHLDGIAQHYGVEVWSDRFWTLTENFVRAAVKRGINMILTPIHTPPLDTDEGGERLTTQLVDIELTDGKYAFGFDKLKRWVSMCERCGVKYYEMAHLFSQWGAKHTPKIVVTVDGKQEKRFGWHTDAQSAEYRAFIGAYLPALIQVLKALHIADRTYFHISDEPDVSQLEDYRAAKELIAPYVDGFPVIDALSSFEFYQKGVLDKPIPANNHIQPFIDAEVPGLWTYYCVGQYKDVSNLFIAMPSARNRIFGVQLYKYKIEGILHWGYNFYNDQHSRHPIDPYLVTDADGFVPGGDPFQVYPGPDGAPEESIRFMVTHMALQDLRAFRWLDSLADRVAVMAIVEEGLHEGIRFDQYPKDAAYLTKLREKVNREIVRRYW